MNNALLSGAAEDDEEQVMVSRVAVNFEPTTPRRLFLRKISGESVSSHISSSHVSLGDIDLMSESSFYSMTSHQSLEDLLFLGDTATTEKKETKKKNNMMYCKLTRRYIWYHPWTRAARKRYRRIPARYKYMCFLLWVGWKFVAAFLVVYFVSSNGNDKEVSQTDTVLRLLYMVTANTILTQQYTETWIESVTTLTQNNRHHVDVVFILGDETVDPNLVISWRQQLPASVDLSIWTDAVPWRIQDGKLVEETDALWQRTRFVMKDRWSQYDVFMSWDTDARVTTAHVDYFWQESQKMTEGLAITGFVSVSLPLANQTELARETGPFDSRVCCGAPKTSLVVQDPTLLALKTPLQHLHENSRMGLLPSHDPRQGWMMTNQQLGRYLKECPSFLPSTDYNPGDCFWQRWLNLDPMVYSYHFVQHSANTASSLSPNRLWKEFGESNSNIIVQNI